MQKPGREKKTPRQGVFHTAAGLAVLVSVFFSLALVSPASLLPVSLHAQTLTTPSGAVDPTKSSFRVTVCDGPAQLNEPSTHMIASRGGGMVLDTSWHKDPNFVACDFNGFMKTAQHLIDIAMVLGVFAAIVLFTWAGYLYITGKEGNIEKAKKIFPKIFFGFIIMVSAWFIVYQLLGWLTGNSGFSTLLGTP